MLVLTQDESEELVEHFESRPDIWVLHNGVWVRKLHPRIGEGVGVALKIAPHIEPGFYALAWKAYAYSPEAAERYVQWVVEKYTARPERVKIMGILRVHGMKPERIEAASRDVCLLRQGTFIRRHERRVRGEDSTIAAGATETPV